MSEARTVRALAFVGVALALAALGVVAVIQERADDDEAVEAQVRRAFAQVGKDVEVRCRRSGDHWRCDYADGPFRGSVETDESAHFEVSIIH